MLQIPRLIYFLLGIIFLQSCNTLVSVSTINLEIVVPGTIKIPSEYNKIAIRYNNANIAYNPNFARYYNDNKSLIDTINNDSVASRIYYQSFVDHLKYQQFFDTIIEIKEEDYSDIKLNDSLVYSQFDSLNPEDSIFPVARENVFSFTEMINRNSAPDSQKTKIKLIDPEFGLYTKDQIKDIADSTKADLLFSLDYYASVDGVFSPNFKNEDSDSLKIEQAYIPKRFFATEIVNVLSQWNYYDLKKLELIYSQRKLDTIKWDSPAENIFQAIQKLPPRIDAVLNAADIAATKNVEFLVPHWIEVTRMYYKSGQVDLQKTEQLIKENRWLEAAEIWKKNTTNKNKSVAAKSMYNMALACEINGDFDAAIDWAVKSFHVFGSKNEIHAQNCQDYIRILGQRKVDIKKIEN